MAAGAAGVGPLTDQVWGQNVPVPRAYAFTPGNAIAPVPTGFGAAPLATLPPGASASYGGGGGNMSAMTPSSGGASLGPIPLKSVLILGGLFVLGVLGLYYVHWKP